MDNLNNENEEGGAPPNAPTLGNKDRLDPISEGNFLISLGSPFSPSSMITETIIAQGTDLPQCDDNESTSTTRDLRDSLKDLDMDTGGKRKKTNLSGAARKRLAHLKRSGLSSAEALELCQLKIMDRTTPVTTNKRSRSDDSTPQATPAKKGNNNKYPVIQGHGASPKSRPKNEEVIDSSEGQINKNKTSYSDITKAIRLAVIDQGFPDVKLNSTQMTAIQDSIMDAVAELPLDGISPTFLGCRATNGGWLSVNCADKDTAAWLTATVPNLKPFENANLKSVGIENLERPKIFFVYLPHCRNETNEKILRRLQVQNRDLRSADWKIMSRKDRENDVTQVVFSVSHKTTEILKGSNYKVNWLFGSVYFRPKTEQKELRAPKEKVEGAQTQGKTPSNPRTGTRRFEPKAGTSGREREPRPGPSGLKKGQNKPGVKKKKHGLPQMKRPQNQEEQGVKGEPKEETTTTGKEQGSTAEPKLIN